MLDFDIEGMITKLIKYTNSCSLKWNIVDNFNKQQQLPNNEVILYGTSYNNGMIYLSRKITTDLQINITKETFSAIVFPSSILATFSKSRYDELVQLPIMI